MEQSEKIKISSDFFFTKILFIAILVMLLLLLTDYKRTEISTLIEYSVIFIVLSLLLFYLFTRPAIYYDNKNLYIIKGTKLNIEIPLQKIQSINFSVMGFGQGGYSYRIKYFNIDNEIKAQRIFSSFFANPISKFISCTKKQNSKVKITNWSFGINEFFE
jgi:hypothetical protein